MSRLLLICELIVLRFEIEVRIGSRGDRKVRYKEVFFLLARMLICLCSSLRMSASVWQRICASTSLAIFPEILLGHFDNIECGRT